MSRLHVSWQRMLLLFASGLLVIVFEGVGIAILFPILELLRVGGSVESAELNGVHWKIMREVSANLGIPLGLGLLLAISFGFILLRQVVKYLNVYLNGAAKRNAEHRNRRQAFLGFLSAGTALQERARTGEVVGNVTVELQRALGAIFGVVPAVTNLLQMMLYIAGLFLLSVGMTLLAIGVIGFAIFLARRYLAEIKRSGRAITESNVQLMAFMVERLKHVRLIRLSGMDKAEAAAYAKLSRRHADEQLHHAITAARISLLPEPIAVGFAFFVLFVGAQVFGLSLGSLALFVVVLIRLLPILRGLIADHENISGKWPSVEKLDTHLSALLEAQERSDGDKVFDRLEHGIRYEHVTFRYYKAAVDALHDITVTLPAERMSALVGPSGAGKSTFVDLLPRLRDPNEGEMLLDGVPIKSFTLASLRAGIGFVSQDPQIFDITAAEHIRYGKEDATDDEVREAARLAGALHFIEALPDGFNARLGDGGFMLSRGQRQRLDIARALVRRAPILILDEPTSALDAEAEAAFREALQTLRDETNLTIIVIAHRLSTITGADQIVVLRRGRVDAVGSHEELLAAGGWYANAFRSQYRGRELDNLQLAIGS